MGEITSAAKILLLGTEEEVVLEVVDEVVMVTTFVEMRVETEVGVPAILTKTVFAGEVTVEVTVAGPGATALLLALA